MRIVQSLVFFPRGGSAQVAKYLSRSLIALGHDVDVVAGSFGVTGDFSFAESFYDGLKVVAADYNGAAEAGRVGRDPLLAEMPFHPSYEDRGPDAPDRLFLDVSPAVAAHGVAAWTRFYEHHQILADADVLHVHHLTLQHEAVAALHPDKPLVVHLHGTELDMLALAGALGPEEREQRYPHFDYWRMRMRNAAGRANRVLVTSPGDVANAHELLQLDVDNVECVPNGVDNKLFQPYSPERKLCRRHDELTKVFVSDPQGWTSSGEVGSLSYTSDDIGRFFDADGRPRPIVLYVGRFTAVKRISVLLDAFQRTRSSFEDERPQLVVWGGYPGEWEGTHPHDYCLANQIDDVWFAGWRGHGDLASFLPLVDLLVLPSVHESFGQVLLESMACEVPVIAVNRGGPPSFVATEGDRRNGWLVEPDDVPAFESALGAALSSPSEREYRGGRGRQLVDSAYSWDGIAKRVDALYRTLVR